MYLIELFAEVLFRGRGCLALRIQQAEHAIWRLLEHRDTPLRGTPSATVAWRRMNNRVAGRASEPLPNLVVLKFDVLPRDPLLDMHGLLLLEDARKKKLLQLFVGEVDTELATQDLSM